MKIHRAPFWALWAFGLSGDPMPAAAQLATDMKLEDAGFIMRPADTPQKLERLRLLPPRKFAKRTKNGRPYYLWPDPDYCKCVFVGGPEALQAFRDMRARLPQPDVVGPGGISVQDQMMHDMDLDAGINVPDGDVLDYHM